MIIGLVLVLALILVLPFVFRPIEHNLEYFLFSMGILATVISGAFSGSLFLHIFENYLLYMITGAVLVAGLLFRLSVSRFKQLVTGIVNRIPLKIFVFLIIVVLGIVSSLITAIIAALILVEIIQALSLSNRKKLQLAVISCFSIGLGAALTPIGEPLSTIVVSALGVDFFYLIKEIGIYIIPGIICLGILGAFLINNTKAQEIAVESGDGEATGKETLNTVFLRAFKVFIFVIALELLGAGFKPLINNYVIHLNSMVLYWINMSSAVLDNATIAAAEISPVMEPRQIRAILMGLLLSGGMLIPGNIPNIIAAGKLNIKSREWASIGLPLGVALLLVYFVILFVL